MPAADRWSSQWEGSPAGAGARNHHHDGNHLSQLHVRRAGHSTLATGATPMGPQPGARTDRAGTGQRLGEEEGLAAW